MKSSFRQRERSWQPFVKLDGNEISTQLHKQLFLTMPAVAEHTPNDGGGIFQGAKTKYRDPGNHLDLRLLYSLVKVTGTRTRSRSSQ